MFPWNKQTKKTLIILRPIDFNISSNNYNINLIVYRTTNLGKFGDKII